MVRSDLGDISWEGGRSVIGSFAHPLLPFPSSPHTTTGGEERPEVLVGMGERLGAAVGEEGDVPFARELQTGLIRARL